VLLAILPVQAAGVTISGTVTAPGGEAAKDTRILLV